MRALSMKCMMNLSMKNMKAHSMKYMRALSMKCMSALFVSLIVIDLLERTRWPAIVAQLERP